MTYTIFTYQCLSKDCPISRVTALAITTHAKPIEPKCTPRCLYCAQLTTPVGRMTDELRSDEALGKGAQG